MKELTMEEIQAKFETLPPEMKAAVRSPDVLDTIENIGKRHNLMIDQIGDLVDQIVLIMLGFEHSSTFVADISKRLSLKEDRARRLAKDVNAEVFAKLKTHMREAEEASRPSINQISPEQKRQDLSALEHAGGFSVEPEKDENSNGNSRFGDVTSADKNKILSGIEDTGNEKVYKEPLVDQLLKSGTIPAPKPVPTPLILTPIPPKPTAPAASTPKSPTPPKPPAPKGPDPYREPS
jgi:hypothetical protein